MMFGRKRIYLAGPEVFLPFAKIEGWRLKTLCDEHGLEGRFPLDEEAGGATDIYQACVAGVRACDAVVANISPFRGPHMDPGTAFEIGYAIALGKPVFGWTSHPGHMHTRIPHEHDASADLRIDRDRLLVEDFGHPENLMICEVLMSIHETPQAAIAAAAAALRRGR
ncbi:MAG: nucleoside 2-deoxyribosyltransferase [Pseudomonadota bacterium]